MPAEAVHVVASVYAQTLSVAVESLLASVLDVLPYLIWQFGSRQCIIKILTYVLNEPVRKQ